MSDLGWLPLSATGGEQPTVSSTRTIKPRNCSRLRAGRNQLIEKRLQLTQAKFEHNDYTGFEFQPTGSC